MNYFMPTMALTAAFLAGCGALEKREPAGEVIPPAQPSSLGTPQVIVPATPPPAPVLAPAVTAAPPSAPRRRAVRPTPMICENKKGDPIPCPPGVR